MTDDLPRRGHWQCSDYDGTWHHVPRRGVSSCGRVVFHLEKNVSHASGDIPEDEKCEACKKQLGLSEINEIATGNAARATLRSVADCQEAT